MRSVFFRKYGSNQRYLGEIDELIGGLRARGCAGIPRKIAGLPRKDAHSSLRMLASTVSELRFASLFSEHNWEVQMVSEDGDSKSPDMVCESGGDAIVVEVTSLAEDAIMDTVLGFLRLLLKVMPRLRVLINLDLKYELSIPELRKEGRYRQNRLVIQSIGEFMKQLYKSYPPDSPFEIDTEGIVFSIEPVTRETGLPGIIHSQAILVPETEMLERVAEDLCIKAGKSTSFKTALKGVKYVVCYDCGEPLLDSSSFDRLLYGGRTGLDARMKREWLRICQNPETVVPHWDRIQRSRNMGWGDFLVEKGMVPCNLTYLSEPGAFLSVPEMDDVTAVIMRIKARKIHYYPNPFCRNDINLCGGNLLLAEQRERPHIDEIR